MENKLKLIGLGNNEEDNRSFFFIEKKDIFLDIFNSILKKLNIPELIYDELGAVQYKNNEINHFKNINYDIDIIYTSNRIIIIVRASQKCLEHFKSIILDCSE